MCIGYPQTRYVVGMTLPVSARNRELKVTTFNRTGIHISGRKQVIQNTYVLEPTQSEMNPMPYTVGAFDPHLLKSSTVRL